MEITKRLQIGFVIVAVAITVRPVCNDRHLDIPRGGDETAARKWAFESLVGERMKWNCLRS
jgi:hypothetical protein